MKKRMRFLPLLLLVIAFAAFLLFLRRYEGRYPEKAADGAAWDRGWTMLGSVLGVEDPGNGLVLLDNNAALSYQDIHYATWAVGDPISYTNDAGDEVALYEAQLYLLVYGCADGENAQIAVKEWMDREKETYAVTDVRDESRNGQAYTLLCYETVSETNPYNRGVSAFAVYENYAVSVELSCRDLFSGDEEAILAEFLTGCHYSAETGG